MKGVKDRRKRDSLTSECYLTNFIPKASSIISQRRTLCASDADAFVTSENGDREITQPIKIKIRSATAQKMKFSIKDIFSKCNQIRSLRIWSHLLEKFLMENLIFCAVCHDLIQSVHINIYQSSIYRRLRLTTFR